LRGRLADVERAGATLVLVGSGTPEQARHFAEHDAGGLTVLADPSLRAYRALDLKRGKAATLGPRSLLAGARSTLHGHVQGRLAGDPWQQGGLFAVAPGGEILFSQRNQDAADRPRLDDALEAVRRWTKAQREAS
jgi:hypothetical protein